MARIHSHRRGKSHSTRPSSKRTPNWVNLSQDEILSSISKMSKDGLGQSMIGMRLRDEYGIPLVKTMTGKGIRDLLREAKQQPRLPEDLGRLVERAGKLRTHLTNNPGDRKNVRSLELLEAKIHRISNYYKTRKDLPSNWKYSAVIAQLA